MTWPDGYGARGARQYPGAIADITVNAGQPAGVLKLNGMSGFGMDFLLPLMPAFLERYPAVTPDCTSITIRWI
ncbi:hypothetical protein [Pseudomonas syringae]|uniref:hypothetical protein n=1 Tax=Pseudomonas syringae TaxID=317 RepID=UPI003F776251